MHVDSQQVIEESHCDPTGRAWRWPEGILWPSCPSHNSIKRGWDDRVPTTSGTVHALNPFAPRSCHPDGASGWAEAAP